MGEARLLILACKGGGLGVHKKFKLSSRGPHSQSLFPGDPIRAGEMIYDICYFLAKAICKLLFRLRVEGVENVPRFGPAILASNHVSYLDPIFVGVSLPRKMHYMAKEEIFRNPIAAWFIHKLQGFPISRQRAGSSSIKRAVELMREGKVLLLFPEGTRGDGKTLQRPKPGMAVIAELSRAPLIPVYLDGPGQVLPRGSRWLRFHPVKVTFGTPVHPRSGTTSVAGEAKKVDYELLLEDFVQRMEEIRKKSQERKAP